MEDVLLVFQADEMHWVGSAADKKSFVTCSSLAAGLALKRGKEIGKCQTWFIFVTSNGERIYAFSVVDAV